MLERIWKAILRRRYYSLLGIPAFFLWLLSFVYRLGVWLKKQFTRHPKCVGVPVISVGNITVGGSGKTPLVAFIARDLLNVGIRVGIVSSAYGRQDSRPFVTEGYYVQKMTTDATGDEVKLLAMGLPDAVFSVDRNKTQAALALAESGKVDVLIVDDGFQHFGLARDIDIVAFDAGVEPRHLKAFPYGLLREPISALTRAEVIIVTRAKLAVDLNNVKRRLQGISPASELYHASFHIESIIGPEQTLPVKYLDDKSAFLFAGVGNFHALKRQVSALVADIDFALELSDHQRYDQPLLRHIKRLVDRHESDVILTTMKDWVKLGDFDFGREIYYLDLEVDLDPGEERLVEYLRTRLRLPKGAA
jgi:tetraacyldisaccharide 4'-kinase